MNDATSLRDRPVTVPVVALVRTGGGVTAELLPSGLVPVYLDGQLVGSWRRTTWRARLVPYDVRTPEQTRAAAERVLVNAPPAGWRPRLRELVDAIDRASDWELFDADALQQIPRWLQVAASAVFVAAAATGLIATLRGGL